MAGYQWGEKSLKVRATLDPRLQLICDQLLKYIDLSLIYGHRSKDVQDTLYVQGRSKLKWPASKHNRNPSLAVDLQPYPVPRDEGKLRAALGFIAGLAIRIAEERGVVLRWGGDWNRNGSVIDNNFDDLYHLEIVE